MSRSKISDFEFISLMASMMALSALSIDALLPGLREIGGSIGITDPKDNQILITMIFFGLGIGQLISGTLSDSLGRKRVVYIGYLVFALASVLCVFSVNLEMMIVGRLLQGIGLSAPRSVSMSIIRDKYNGNHMARIMSFVSVIFILAPIVAPSLGKLLLDAFGWQSIFYSQLIYGFLVLIWLWRRQPETLTAENRKKMRLSLFVDGTKEFFRHRHAVVYTIVIGVISAPFLAYISASQQIFQEQYNLVEEYTYIFSGLALGIGLATYLNGRYVVKVGMYKLATISTVAMFVISFIYLVMYGTSGNPPSVVLIVFLFLILFSTGFNIGNFNALAMEPVGNIAGIGAAIVGFASTLITIPLATVIGRYVEDTAMPVFLGFVVCGAISLLLIFMVSVTDNARKKKEQDFQSSITESINPSI